MDHLINPEVVRHFEWDAQKIFKYDGERYTRIYTEPWTGKRFWDIQVSRLNCFKNYADISFKDVTARRSKNGLSRALCRQDPAFVVWDRKGVSRHGEDRQPPRQDQER